MGRADYIRHYDAMLRYYMHIPNPEDLDDVKWAMAVKELEWIRAQEENEAKKGQIRGR